MVSGPAPCDNALRTALRRCRNALWLPLGFGLVVNVLFLAAPLYLIQVFDRVLASQRVETLLMLTLIVAFALVVMGVLEAVRGRLLTRIGNWLESAISTGLVEGSIRAALAGADVNAQALRDANLLRNFISGGLRAFLDLPWMPLFLVALWLLHPALGAFALGAAAVLLLLAALGEATTRRAADRASAGRLANEALAGQAIRNAEVLGAMGMMPRFLDLWTERQADILALDRRTGDGKALMLGASRAARLLAQTGILGLGAWYVIAGELTAGAIVAASILMGRALAPAEQAIGAWRDMIAARAARARLEALTGAMPAKAAPMALPPPAGHLAVRDLWYVPRPGDEPTLKGIGFALAAGEAMAVVGPSASGKTTLCKLLVGAWAPTRGHVRLDSADVHSEWPAELLGAHLGYVPQDMEFFAATVQQTIARLDSAPDPAEVVAAAAAARVHETILALPQGYDTPIGPGGLYLSGGQRQRIALARALYGRPRLVVLDEPDANLDAAGEAALAAALAAVAAWRGTVVLVTHNPRLLGSVDRILVLDGGRARLCGPRDEVLRQLQPATPSTAAAPARREAGTG